MQKKQDILAVQSLRNWIMASSFLATSAVFTIFGFLAFFGNVGSRSDTTSPTNPLAGLFFFVEDPVFGVKLLTSSAQIAVEQLETLDERTQATYKSITPKSVARMLDRASMFQTIGLRMYYASFMAIAYIWGPYFLLGITIILLLMLRSLDLNVSHHFESETHRNSVMHSAESIVMPTTKRRWWWWRKEEGMGKETEMRRRVVGEDQNLEMGESRVRLDPAGGGQEGWAVASMQGVSSESFKCVD
ncbi:hypothetical protein HDU67_004944 [Dinochytrium kinnereticum]|nr:hypothetical protein HDU67_004944 [Dinochytrium kinnereticum]